ncbi:MAG: hypothetical protein HY669_04605 [Chloroflexi bacterium]|nr:hypothetical protein [Chloroflexota bacterium]
MRELLRDRLVLTGLVLVVLTAALIAFVASSALPTAHPLLGVVTYSLLPAFFAAGAIIFYLAVQRESRKTR